MGDFVKVETKRLFQSSWLRAFSCSKFDKDLTGANDSQCLTNESMANRGETRPMRGVITCGPTFFCNVPTFLPGRGPVGPSF